MYTALISSRLNQSHSSQTPRRRYHSLCDCSCGRASATDAFVGRLTRCRVTARPSSTAVKSVSVPDDQSGPPIVNKRTLPPVACCISADSVWAETSQAGVADICFAIAARAGATTADSISRTEAVDTRCRFLTRSSCAARPSLTAAKLVSMIQAGKKTMSPNLPPVACGVAANSIWRNASQTIIADICLSIALSAEAANTGSRGLRGRLRRGAGLHCCRLRT